MKLSDRPPERTTHSYVLVRTRGAKGNCDFVVAQLRAADQAQAVTLAVAFLRRDAQRRYE